MNSWARTALGVVAAGAGTVAYAAGIERRQWTLREATLPVLPPGARSLKVLHLSDLHLWPTQEKKIRWVNELAALEPDLIVNTGDNLSHEDSVRPLLRAYGDLLDVPGVFVFGSNDYWKPHFKNPGKYLLPAHKQRHKPHGPDLPYEEMRRAFTGAGWTDLKDQRGAGAATRSDAEESLRETDRYAERSAGALGVDTGGERRR